MTGTCDQTERADALTKKNRAKARFKTKRLLRNYNYD